MKNTIKSVVKKIVMLLPSAFFVVFLIGHVPCYIGATEVRSAEYIVKINNISMYSESAKSILRRIKDSEKNVTIYDNFKEEIVLLPEVEKNMDITIDKSNFMKIVSKLYRICCEEDGEDLSDTVTHIFENVDRKCMKIDENNVEIYLCVDKKDKVVLNVSYWN